MNILQTNLNTQNYIQKLNSNLPAQNNSIQYLQHDSSRDVFVKSSSSPGFKGAPQNIYKKILETPELAQKLMSLMAMGTAFLVAKSAEESIEKEGEKDLNLANIFGAIPTDTQAKNIDTEKEELIKENQRLKEENQQYKAMLEKNPAQKAAPAETVEKAAVEAMPEIESDAQEDASIITEAKEEEAAVIATEVKEEAKAPLPERNFKITFPTKIGKYSEQQMELKTLVESLRLTEESGMKLTEICKILIDNSLSTNPKAGLYKQYTKDLLNDLSNSTSDSKTDEIINKYKEIIEKDIKSNAEPSEEQDSTKEVSTKGLTVLGKIDLNEPVEGRFTQLKFGKPEEDYSKTSRFNIIDESTGKMEFQIPGTIDPNLKRNLKRLLLRMQDAIMAQQDGKGKWMFRSPISTTVFAEDALSELKRHSKKTDPWRYKNINNTNILEVIDVLNSDDRFQELFTLHSAMRLIDRFVDFNSEVSLEEQCKHILDEFKNIMQASFKKKLEVDAYEDSKNHAIGFRLTINPEVYSESAKDIFGTYPLTIAICEDNLPPPNYNKKRKLPLICTIFPQGI